MQIWSTIAPASSSTTRASASIDAHSDRAAWALGRVGSAEARSALSSHLKVETDARVLEEFSSALDA
jgi:hypothetical protein